MERDQAKDRGAALRAHLLMRLPVPDANSITALARKAGLRPSTVTAWWTRGTVPDAASLQLIAKALNVDLGELVAAYQSTGVRTWVLTDPELEALLTRAAEEAVRRVLAERKQR
jgi:transcriptional regulator with XRE-family HTH domain